MEINKYKIEYSATILDALKQLNQTSTFTLFVQKNDITIGTVTDGDIRRGLINGRSLNDTIEKIMLNNFYFLDNKLDVEYIKKAKNQHIKLLPLLDENKKLKKVFDLQKLSSVLPLTAVIMAGGKGERLRPLTEKLPKPLIKIGNKPIIEHNIDRLISHGIETIYISVNYLKDQIIGYLGDGSSKRIKISYIEENKPLGTAGALSLVEDFKNDVLLINSDIFTNIDYEDFYLAYLKQNADIAIASIPYTVNIPYAILEEEHSYIKSFKEKPSKNYFANAGLYIIKKELTKTIPKNTFFNATDLMQSAINKNLKIIQNPVIGYWIDIGNHSDLEKAKEIAKHVKHE